LEPGRFDVLHRLAGVDIQVVLDGMKGRKTVRFSSLPGRENLWKQKPMGVTRMKQGGSGCGRSKASRG